MPTFDTAECQQRKDERVLLQQTITHDISFRAGWPKTSDEAMFSLVIQDFSYRKTIHGHART